MYKRVKDIEGFPSKVKSKLKELRFNGPDLVRKIKDMFSLFNTQVEEIRKDAEDLNIYKLNVTEGSEGQIEYKSSDSQEGPKKEIIIKGKSIEEKVEGEDYIKTISMRGGGLIHRVKDTEAGMAVFQKEAEAEEGETPRGIIIKVNEREAGIFDSFQQDKITFGEGVKVTASKFLVDKDTAEKSFKEDYGVVTKIEMVKYLKRYEDQIKALETRVERLENPVEVF